MSNKKPLWHKAKRAIHFPWEIGETVCGKADQYFIKNDWDGVKCKECLCKINSKRKTAYCSVCGKQYTSGNRVTSLCSTKCSEDWAATPMPEPSPCEECGEPKEGIFYTYRTDTTPFKRERFCGQPSCYKGW